MKSVAVVALGKIGLPLAVQIARSGHRTIGVDISTAVVDLVNSGTPPFPGEAHLDEFLAEVIESGDLVATTDTAEAVGAADVVIVVVPLVVDDEGRPDFGGLDAASKAIAPALRPGTLVSYETTLPVGTTRNRLTPILEEGSGLSVGDDLFVVHSPERVYSGRVFADLRKYPKLVGGVTAECGRRGTEFYRVVLQFDDRDDLARPNGVWDLGSVEAAELAKLAETTYRDVNIALANEFAVYSERIGVDVYQVIEAANSQPFSHIHRPGVAVGGHCIPVYPRFYLTGHDDARVPAAARNANEAMPDHTAGRLDALVDGGVAGRSVVVLGAAYRGGVKEVAFSGVFPLTRALERRGATVTVLDPLYDDDELIALGLAPHSAGSSVDAIVVQADHREFKDLGPSDFPGVALVLDGRNWLDPVAWEPVPVHTLGDGSR